MSEATVVAPAAAPSRLRAFFYLIWLSWQRQARAHVLVWISLGLLALTACIVYLIDQQGRWTMAGWRYPPKTESRFNDYLGWVAATELAPGNAELRNGQNFVWTALYATLHNVSGFYVFSNSIAFTLFTTFLLPLWSLTFATEGLGREREARNLLWVLTRPLSRPAVYLAKYLALLPWCLLLNMGGFVVLCLFARAPGRVALAVYWPAVFWATLAFAALFHLMGACLRRAPVAAILYAFFLETFAGNLPGHFKRLSISFYTRCLMFDRAHTIGLHPDRPGIYLPVSGPVALGILAGATVGLLIVGMVVFARREYLDLT